VLPGPAALRPPSPARLDWTVTVDEHAWLDWRPEPTVVAQGAVLRARTTVTVAGTGRVRWREVLAAGRVGEQGGDVLTSWSVVVAGRSLLRQDVHIGPHAPTGWDGLAGTAGMRVLGTLLVVEPVFSPCSHSSDERAATRAVARVGDDGWLAVLPLEGPATLVTALGPTTAAVTGLLDQAEAGVAATRRSSESVRVLS
jgi:urease accessory protein